MADADDEIPKRMSIGYRAEPGCIPVVAIGITAEGAALLASGKGVIQDMREAGVDLQIFLFGNPTGEGLKQTMDNFLNQPGDKALSQVH